MISRWARLLFGEPASPVWADEMLKGMVAASSMRDTAVGLELYDGVFCIGNEKFLERIWQFGKCFFWEMLIIQMLTAMNYGFLKIS